MYEDDTDAAWVERLPMQTQRSLLPQHDVRALMRGAREAVLLHGREEYRLKITAAGKLILTK